MRHAMQSKTKYNPNSNLNFRKLLGKLHRCPPMVASVAFCISLFSTLPLYAQAQETPVSTSPLTTPVVPTAPEAGQAPAITTNPNLLQEYTPSTSPLLYFQNLQTSALPYTYFVVPTIQPSPRMAEQTRRILALRRLLELGFNIGDCQHALHLLERLRDIKTAPPADPERALEEEYRALLTARPADPLPPSSAVKIMDAAAFYREEQAKVWMDMAREIGTVRATGLRVLIGQNVNQDVAQWLSWQWAPAQIYRQSLNGALPRSSAGSRDKGTSTLQPQPQVEQPQSGTAALGTEGVPRSIDPQTKYRLQLPDSAAKTKAEAFQRKQPNTLYVPGVAVTSSVSTSYSPATVRLSLDEMIALLSAKVKAMTGKAPATVPSDSPSSGGTK